MHARVFNLNIDGDKLPPRTIDVSDFVDVSCHGGPDLADHIEATLLDRFDAKKVEFAYRKVQKRRDIGVRSLTVVRTERAYGGPEEGGWYYDADEQVRTFCIPAPRYARLHRLLSNWCAARNSNRTYGDDRFVIRDGLFTPTPRPHYC